MTSPTAAAERAVVTHGFSRRRYALMLAVPAAAISLFVLWSLNIGHGVYAFVVLGVAVVALTLFGGPEGRARTVTITPDRIRIERFHRIGTVVERAELVAAEATSATGLRSAPESGACTQVVLVLTPRDPVQFFTAHRELRAVRVGDAAHVPAGSSEQTARELSEALSTHLRRE